MIEDEEQEDHSLPSRRFAPIDLLVVASTFAYQITSAVAQVFDTTTMLIAQHANYLVDKQEFADEARRNIEQITEGM